MPVTVIIFCYLMSSLLRSSFGKNESAAVIKARHEYRIDATIVGG